ncbi:MAG: hypothetical protein JW850_04590 [Thermoflexales bacterium]|nr:hypothetical protein [Thermoflexales bacterium]
MSNRAVTIALVGCSARKLDHPAPALDLYQGVLFKAARAWAERNADGWFVLSAKHGLIGPGQMIEPYDQTLNRMSAAARREWAERVYQRMWAMSVVASVMSFTCITWVFLAGQAYCAPILLFTKVDVGQMHIAFETPLAHLGIGQQIRWLRAAGGEKR